MERRERPVLQAVRIWLIRKLPLKVDSDNWTFLAGLKRGGKFRRRIQWRSVG